MLPGHERSRPHRPAFGGAPPTAIALYFYKLGAAGGGAERMVCQLAAAMAQSGFIVHLITWDASDASAFYPIDPAVRWSKLGFAPGAADKLRRVRALYRTLRDNRIRLLVGFVMSGDRTVWAAAKLAGVKLVAAERNAPQMYWFRYGHWARWMTFRVLGLADRITIQMAGFASGYPAALQSRLVTIPNPVPAADVTAAPDLADATGHWTLLAVSRLDAEQKRVDCLVSAFARVAPRFPQWQLRIVGDGAQHDALLESIAALGLSERVRIEASTPAIFAVYAASHLFVIPSRWEGFPNALAEAMSAGLPAVGFQQAAGVAELIGDAGWLASGLDDPQSLADALQVGMADDAGRARLGRAAAARMAQFEPAQQFERWRELLQSVLAEGGA
jgi:GalNAc-alpha-(1->4)-GalNAc-alpha-(1->3)-diNAcBac-PP-undecaprenol alpha-1,4-N-acetyl-D-galactosaminyltransferase